MIRTGALRDPAVQDRGTVHKSRGSPYDRGSQGEQVTGLGGIDVRTPNPESNMVFFGVEALGMSDKDFVAAMAEHGVKLGAVGGAIRAVTHLDVSAEDIQTTIAAVRELSSGSG